MKLTVNIDINAATFADEAENAIAQALAALLKYAKMTHNAVPLEAHVCAAFQLSANPDYPIAAISAQVDGIELGKDYCLRAEPVHLLMQRDAFSLGEDIPLNVSSAHAEALLAMFNQHFNEDGLQFMLGKSGAWYLKVPAACQDYFPVSTTLPQIAVAKNIHHFMPQGNAAKKWRAILNEAQMLLHEHPINLARASLGESAINSLWLSGGGVMPNNTSLRSPDLALDNLMIFAETPFYQGLAALIGAQCAPLPTSADALLQTNAQHGYLVLNTKNAYFWLLALYEMLKMRKISTLNLNVGCFDQTLIAQLTPRDLYKFWRQTKPLQHYF